MASPSSPGDEDGGRQRADRAGREGTGEGGVERLEHHGVRQPGGDLRRRRRVRRHDETVEGLEVDRVGDVHDDPAAELVPALLDDLRHGRVRHGEDDQVTETVVPVSSWPISSTARPALLPSPAIACPLLPVPNTVRSAMTSSFGGRGS
ncbi:hypothetical protein [Micromonospora fluostatini]|uniref:hypothetical protein n=1 Tax=Micromonospora sp. JCM 30529 TaxID=3421643 RepID=UPI003D1859E9